MTLVRGPSHRNKTGAIRLELACLLIILFVALNMLDAELTSLALSLGSSEANYFAREFGFDIVLKALVSGACIMPLLLVRWWRVIPLLCVGMSAVILWNSLAILTWL